MMHVGIFTGYFPYGLEETAQKIQAQGITPCSSTWASRTWTCRPTRSRRRSAARSATRSATTTCRSAASPATRTSFIPIRPSARSGNDHLKTIIRHARDLGSPYVISETGTFATEFRLGAPSRRTRPRRASRIAATSSASWSRSPMTTARCSCSRPMSTTSSARSNETLRMFAGGGPLRRLGLLMDPTNYFEAHNIGEMDGELNHIFDALSDKIRITHAKDVKLSGDGQVGEARRAVRGRRREPHLPRRRPDRAAGPGTGVTELRPLSAERSPSTTPTSRHHRAPRRERRPAREEVPGRQAEGERVVRAD